MEQTVSEQDTKSRLEEKYGPDIVKEAFGLKEKPMYREQAVIVIVNPEGEILLAQAAKPLKEGVEIWSLPQGGAKSSDASTIKDTASREIKEEFGLEINVGDFQSIPLDEETPVTQEFSLERICSEIAQKDRRFSGKRYHFVSVKTDVSGIKPDEDEIANFIFLEPEDAIQFLREKGAPSKFQMQREAIMRALEFKQEKR